MAGVFAKKNKNPYKNFKFLSLEIFGNGDAIRFTVYQDKLIIFFTLTATVQNKTVQNFLVTCFYHSKVLS